MEPRLGARISLSPRKIKCIDFLHGSRFSQTAGLNLESMFFF